MCVSMDGVHYFSNRAAGYAARMYDQGFNPVTKQPLFTQKSETKEQSSTTKNKTSGSE